VTHFELRRRRSVSVSANIARNETGFACQAKRSFLAFAFGDVTLAPHVRLIAFRGANTVAANDPEAILDATEELMHELIGRNGLETGDLVSCLFTLTPDLNAEFPAVAARRMGLSKVPLMCAQEIGVPGAMESVIRVMIHAYADDRHDPVHVYLGETAALRQDLHGAQ
jgi:chorismate mutase